MDTKISAISTDVGTLAAGDKFPIADVSNPGVNTYATAAEIAAFVQTLALIAGQVSSISASSGVAGANELPVNEAGTAKKITVTQLNTYLQTLALASAQITSLPAASALAAANSFPVDQSGTAGEATFTQLATLLQALGMPRVMSLASQYTNATTTGTSVANLKFAGLVAGNYYVKWVLLVQSVATTTSWSFGVNYTGTVTRFSAHTLFPSAGVTAATGTMHDANNATTGQVHAYANTRTESTTTPNMGPWVGTTNANQNHLIIIEAMVVVSDSGDLELYAASEVAASQMSIEVGSSGFLIRTA